jgi:autotransporter-associated beta strand protein
MPGFVDCHTHPVFAATREREFHMRCQGADYMAIAQKGGGILSSMRAVRAASQQELTEATRERLWGFLQNGTTTSLFKDGANVLTLSGNNSYSGDTRITGGTLTVAAGGSLGNGDSDVFISSGAMLNINNSATIDSVQETGNLNGGVISLGSGATLTIDGADKGTLYQNSISGSGNLAVAASGTTSPPSKTTPNIASCWRRERFCPHTR